MASQPRIARVFGESSGKEIEAGESELVVHHAARQ
jgi:hypothetical protein